MSDTKHPSEYTKADLITVPQGPKFPKKAFRGEIQDANGDNIACMYYHEGRVHVLERYTPFASKLGPTMQSLPETFAPEQVKQVRGLRLSARSTLRRWRFVTSDDEITAKGTKI